jgi:hypothetical protein
MGLGTSPISRVGATADWSLSRSRRRSFIPSELLIRAAANPLKNVLRFPHLFDLMIVTALLFLNTPYGPRRTMKNSSIR